MEIRPPQKPNYQGLSKFLELATGLSTSPENLASRVMGDQFYDPNLVLMAREAGEILGFAFSILDGESAWIKCIAVHPSRRRQGLAREMLERLEERLRGEGAIWAKASFAPGPLFFPGVPLNGADAFFKALAYQSKPGGFVAELESSEASEPFSAMAPDPKRLKALLGQDQLGWWSELEEASSSTPPRFGLSDDGGALCLADEEYGLGPLFASDERGALQALRRALGRSKEKRRLIDFRDPSWWTARLDLKNVQVCADFEKDLRGDSHA